MSKKSDGSQVKESTDSSATMDEDDTKGKKKEKIKQKVEKRFIFIYHSKAKVCNHSLNMHTSKQASNSIYLNESFSFFFFAKLILMIDDKKSGVDRSTTVIAKDPEGNFSSHL